MSSQWFPLLYFRSPAWGIPRAPSLLRHLAPLAERVGEALIRRGWVRSEEPDVVQAQLRDDDFTALLKGGHCGHYSCFRPAR
jgi:hypothetical protein